MSLRVCNAYETSCINIVTIQLSVLEEGATNPQCQTHKLKLRSRVSIAACKQSTMRDMVER